MANDIEPYISVDEESYESKAITAYLAGEINATDLRESLGVSRGNMYRLIERYRQSGKEGLSSRKYGTRNRARSQEERERIISLVSEEYADFGPNPKFLSQPDRGCKNRSKCHYFSRGEPSLSCGQWDDAEGSSILS